MGILQKELESVTVLVDSLNLLALQPSTGKVQEKK